MTNQLTDVNYKVCELLNKWSEGYETELLEMLMHWLNSHSESKENIIYIPKNYGKSNMYIVVDK